MAAPSEGRRRPGPGGCLGISFGYHDSAVALVDSSRIVFAAHEERYSRVKFDPAFPTRALADIAAHVNLDDVDTLVLYEKPVTKLDRQLTSVLAGGPQHAAAFADHAASLRKITAWRPEAITRAFWRALPDVPHRPLQVRYGEHHLSHAAAAFYTSAFEDALVLVLDAVGEWDSQSAWIGRGNDLRRVWSQRFPHSVGLFYSAMTYYLGFKVNTGEYKLMGLAPYGVPRYVDVLAPLIRQLGDGRVALDLRYFSFVSGRTMTARPLERLLGRPRRLPTHPITQWHADMAASVQVILEGVVAGILGAVRERVDAPGPVCLAGGVALNCVMAARLADRIGRDRLHAFPASGDAGGAVGAALSYLNATPVAGVRRWSIEDALLGSPVDDEECRRVIEANRMRAYPLDPEAMARELAARVASGAVAGVFHGRAEFGPRALGNRSIIADPRVAKGQIHINERIKFRESFRPFAPVALAEECGNWFEPASPEPYMLRTTQVRGAMSLTHPPAPSEAGYGRPISITDRLDGLVSPLPSVTHLDGSARLQTIPRGDGRLLRRVLEEFHSLTGCPVLINTSFNVRGEPIVGSPADAVRCFATTGLDLLCLGPFLVVKSEQSQDLATNFASAVDDD